VRCRSGLALACLGAATLLNGGTGRAALPTAPTAPPRAAAFPEVIPRPSEVHRRPGSFVVGSSTPILIGPDAEVRRIARYFVELLHTSRALSLKVTEQKSTPAVRDAIAFRLDPAASALPESYHIEVSAREIVVSSREPRGLFYGAVTLWQLCTAATDSGAIRIPAMQIEDAPRFRWRGLMLDSARHFQSPEFILRYLDWMALHKLNVLSWHLTDDQGWRLEIKKYPRLTGVGAWRVPAGRAAQRDIDPATGRPRRYGGFYSQANVRRIVAHATARNVTIVPEIDLPGHTTAAIVAYPQLASSAAPPREVPADWGIFPNLVNVEESTFEFLEDVLDEVMALFPGRYIHLGGDEAVKDQWQASARVQQRMHELGVADETALQGYFTARLGAYLKAHGRRLVGWDEILQGGVPPEAIVVSWRGVKGALSAAAAGHDAVLAPDPTLYFDNRQGSSPSEPPGRGRVVGLEEVYRFDPLPGSLATDSDHVLGVQGNLWTEHVRTEERAAYMSYPRAAALAEVAWSQPARLDWNDFVRRLAPQFARYRALGIPHAQDAFIVPPAPAAGERHMSQELKTCTEKLVLSLEDDAPVRGPRAVFLMDIMNPCWIFPNVDLSAGAQLSVAVGQVPFNFQLGRDVETIKLKPPATAAGELQVRVNTCNGVPVAVLPLAGAVDNDAVTALPSVRLAALAGHHDLCFTFTQAQLDPMWAIDWVQVSP
jgi:hexosaminidase